MQIVTKQYNNLKPEYPLDESIEISKILFIDIETTGFSAATSNVYLIGCAYYDGNSFTCKQFFAEKLSEEEEIIKSFCEFACNYSLLIHFNGNNFDIPYLSEKCKKYNLECPLSDMAGIDIYKRIAPYKEFLKVPNCKQKTLEQYLGIAREDVYSGGDLIGVYHEYVSHFNVEALAKLLLHNENDIEGMIRLTPILAYSDLFNKKIKVVKVNMERYTDYDGQYKTELVMKLTLPNSLPGSISHMALGCFFKGEGQEGILKVPVVEGELKYFYANYKDYYYLPAEDEALHKSVAGFVDKEHRTQAKASNCYTRVSSVFLKQWSPEFTPFFKKDYASKDLYVELNNERKKDREFFSLYVSHVLNIIGTSN